MIRGIFCFQVLAIVFVGCSSQAANFSLTCGPDGQLKQILAPGLSAKGTASNHHSAGGPACNAAPTCLKQFPKIESSTTDVGDVLRESVNQATDPSSHRKIQQLSDKLQSSLNQCQQSAAPIKVSDSIELNYPNAGLNSGKAGLYDAAVIKQIAQYAISQGTDPYLALAIVLVENPPIKTKDPDAPTTTYREEYGAIPVDQVAYYQQLGCVRSGWGSGNYNYLKPGEAEKYRSITKEQQSAHDALDAAEAKLRDRSLKAAARAEWQQKAKAAQAKADAADDRQTAMMQVFNERGDYSADEADCTNDKTCIQFIAPQKIIPKYDLDFLKAGQGVQNAESRLCSDKPKVVQADSPEITNGSSGCCVSVKGPQRVSTYDLKGVVGANYIHDKVQACLQSAAKPDLESCIQRYNGLGCFGCSERNNSVNNSCFDGIVMADRPIYGARVADLMVNTLMSNGQLTALVDEASHQVAKPVISAFCGSSAQSVHFDSNKYFDLQKSYLLNGNGQAYKAAISGSIRKPASSSEISAYQTREKTRRQACSKYFR